LNFDKKSLKLDALSSRVSATLTKENPKLLEALNDWTPNGLCVPSKFHFFDDPEIKT